MAEAVGAIVVILLRLAFLTVALAAAIEVYLRLTRRGTLGRELWATLLIGTGIVLLLFLSLALSA